MINYDQLSDSFRSGKGSVPVSGRECGMVYNLLPPDFPVAVAGAYLTAVPSIRSL